MEIHNNLENLQALLGMGRAGSAAVQVQPGGRSAAAAGADIGADRATLSSAASTMAVAAGGDGVRPGKVAAVQAALAEGSYSVSAAAVASKLVDAMLGGGR